MMRNVFLTGGSRGIGAATVLALARAGYNVAFTYHAHPEAAERHAAKQGRRHPVLLHAQSHESARAGDGDKADADDEPG